MMNLRAAVRESKPFALIALAVALAAAIVHTNTRRYTDQRTEAIRGALAEEFAEISTREGLYAREKKEVGLGLLELAMRVEALEMAVNLLAGEVPPDEPDS